MEFIMTTRSAGQLLKDRYLYNKNKSRDNTYWKCVVRRSGNRCGVRIAIDQHKVF